MDDFLMQDQLVQQAKDDDIDKKRLGEIINEIGQHHTTLIGVISRRSESVKVIINWWNNNQVGSAINALNMQNDLSVSMDVLSTTLAKNARVNTLKIDNVTSVMPQIISLTNSKYETHLMAGLNSTLHLLRHFGQGLIELKNTPVNPREVDLAREDRIRKADECINQF
mmetsp:Transcript_23338/g.31243  ORF Transcript_23338/g.31243 Transcript_23338/m.31243 type:complete len:168 (-) Transcript_23338:240-743(-)